MKTTLVELSQPTFYSGLDEEIFFIALRMTLATRFYWGRGRHLVVELLAGAEDDPEFDGFLSRFDVSIVKRFEGPRMKKERVAAQRLIDSAMTRLR